MNNGSAEMNEKRSNARSMIELLGLLVGVIGGLCGLAGMVGAFYLLPYRVSAVERKVELLTEQRLSDHELLSRIDERNKQIQFDLNRLIVRFETAAQNKN